MGDIVSYVLKEELPLPGGQGLRAPSRLTWIKPGRRIFH